MTDVAVRRAVPADARALARLRWEFRSPLGSPTEGMADFVGRCADWMASALADTVSWSCWVAESDGAIVGHVWLHRVPKVPNPVAEPEAHAYITNVYVTPTRRGGGIGSRLLRAALDWCEAHDVDSTVLWSTADSRSWYLRHGFVAPAALLERLRSR